MSFTVVSAILIQRSCSADHEYKAQNSISAWFMLKIIIDLNQAEIEFWAMHSWALKYDLILSPACKWLQFMCYTGCFIKNG